MKKPWEDSLILAVRDAQWHRLVAEHNENAYALGSRTPGLFIKLDGLSEQSLADLVVGASDRFYLLEAKSSRSELNSEWSKVVNSVPRPKQAFLKLRALALSRSRIQEKRLLEEELRISSLRCHHFLYWSEEVFDSEDRLGHVHIEPYLLGCAAQGAPGMQNVLKSCHVVEKLSKNSIAVNPLSRDGSRRESLPISALLDGRGQIVASRDEGEQPVFHPIAPMGLPHGQFMMYLRFLTRMASDGDHSINAVICSNRGYIYRLTDFRRLRSVLDKQPAPLPASVIIRPVFHKGSRHAHSPRATSSTTPSKGNRP